ncbi:hypothetical protein [Gilvimarinus polysaccharolyticus]|uniref:hypothetical protein n=1 Tax=Gilvimarinus polysaccharolyticus TaxID=863921 RepID=UPI0006731277|nr:hypothetical protein [Gilvimarinus polysaccharolyticus]
MRKTDKKIDNQIRKILNAACETALNDYFGFQWLTHLVDYSVFPKSLKVVCVFDTDFNLDNFVTSGGRNKLDGDIRGGLADIGIDIGIAHILYDTEEGCGRDHNGRWIDRFKK